MTPRRRSPRTLTFALDALQDRVAPASALGEIQRVWARAVGPAIAAEAVPTAERAGVLTVSCSAAVWAQELDLMGSSILTRLNVLLKSTQVKRLRCVAV
jgi:predicted nucleic acid-binding Zn ribbon protein